MSSWPGWNAFNGPHLAELGVLKVCLKLPFISIYREQIKVGEQLRGCLLWSWQGLKQKNQKHGVWIASRSISVILNQVVLSFLLTNCAHYRETNSEIFYWTLTSCKTLLCYLAPESWMPHVLHRCWRGVTDKTVFSWGIFLGLKLMNTNFWSWFGCWKEKAGHTSINTYFSPA